MSFPLIAAEDSTIVDTVSKKADSLVSKVDSVPMPSFPEMLLQLGIVLVFIVLIIYLVVFLFKKLSGQGRLVHKIDKKANIIDIFPLTNKQAIYIIQLFDNIYILGVSEHQVNLIEKITEEAQKQDILQKNAQKNSKKFAQILKRFQKK